MTGKRIAVLGGGITGLAAAHRLRELDETAHVTVFEASERLGGVLHTEQVDGCLVEHSADNFITDPPWCLELCRRLGLEDQLVSTNAVGRRAYVLRRGKLLPVPDGFLLMAPRDLWPIAATRILSPLGKLRLAMEALIPQRSSAADESLGDFARRRLGREVFDRLVQPLVGGIYTADPEKLSMQAAMPRFVQLEREFGSLYRGLRREPAAAPGAARPTADSGARYSQFVAPRGGMGALVHALAVRLPSEALRTRTAVNRLEPLDDGAWRLHLDSTAPPETFNAVCVALPAPSAAQVLQSADPLLSSLLGQISYAGCTVAIVAAKRADVERLPVGFGVVVPEIERRRILAISFSSHKYPGRAPDDTVLIRVFLGGACHPEVQSWSDDEVIRGVRQELTEILGLRGGGQVLRVLRWTDKMPQYHVGHVDLVRRIRERLAVWPTLALAGNAYEGVGVPQCVRSAEQAAERLTAAFRRAV